MRSLRDRARGLRASASMRWRQLGVRVRWRAAMSPHVLRRLANMAELLLEPVELLVGEILAIDQPVSRAADRVDELVELEVQRLGVAVLAVLDQEHDQKRDD